MNLTKNDKLKISVGSFFTVGLFIILIYVEIEDNIKIDDIPIIIGLSCIGISFSIFCGYFISKKISLKKNKIKKN